jgi:DNA-binding MarR family transcriptional regulator
MSMNTETDNEGNLQKPRDLSGLSWKPRVPLYDNPLNATRGTNSTDGKQRSRDAEDMLIKVRRKAHLTLTPLYAELGLSGYKGQKTKDELIRAGLVEEVSLPANRRGRRKKLLQILPKGIEYLERLGIVHGSKGRGGVRHLYYQEMVRRWYENHGYTAEVEARIGSTSLDVLVIAKDGKRIGIELALSSEFYELVNAQKALESGLECILFLCETDEMIEKLRRLFGAKLGNWPDARIGFKLVTDYLED